MRVLCTINGSPSHTRSMVPITRALADAGHDVLIAVAPELAPGVRDERRVEISECLIDPIETILMRGRELALRGPNSKGGKADANAAQRRLGGIIGASMWPESTKNLLPIAEEFRPDIVVRDDFEFAGYLVAETLRVPHVAVTGGLTNQVDPAQLPDPMLVHGPALGLEPRPDAGLYRFGRIDYMAPSFSFAAKAGPAQLSYCQPVLRRPGDTLPQWLATRDRDRPLVLAAVGTALNRIKRCEQYGIALPDWFDPAKPIRTMAAALSEVDCTAVLTTGGIEVGDLEHGENVHLVTDIAQPLALEVADLLVTHGGYNSVRESIRAGVPMVVQPGSADQPHNARRVAEFGMGIAVTESDAADLAQACRTVLGDPRYALAVQDAKLAMLTLPDPAAVADDLTRIAAEASVTV